MHLRIVGRTVGCQAREETRSLAEVCSMSVVAVMRHESSFGTWTHAEWTPAPDSALAGAIERIWYFDGDLGAARERVFPEGTLEVIVQLDTPHRPGIDGAVDRFPPVCVTGIRTCAEVVEAPPGRCRVLGVRLAPPGACALVGDSLASLTAQTADLHDLLGRSAAELGARVHAARSGAHAVRAAALWAAKRISGGPAVDASVERARRAIVADGGTISIAELDAWHGRSRARFAAAFRDAVGVSPKRFARIVRFDRALRTIAGGSQSLGQIALACGYYDQSHFANEFREHAGLTPTAYLRALRYPGGTSLLDGSTG